jgi:hypothetical protein
MYCANFRKEREGMFGTRHVCFNFEVVSGHFEVSLWMENAITYVHPSNVRDYRNILVVSKLLSLLVCSLETRTCSPYKFCLKRI